MLPKLEEKHKLKLRKMNYKKNLTSYISFDIIKITRMSVVVIGGESNGVYSIE